MNDLALSENVANFTWAWKHRRGGVKVDDHVHVHVHVHVHEGRGR